MRKIIIVGGLAILVSACSNAAEEAVRNELIDPDSAEFRDVKKCSGDSNITTGEVNGKNRMGAYTGFEPFFIDGSIVYFAGSSNFLEVMERCYDTSSPMEGAALDAEANGPATEDSDNKLGKWSTNEKRDPIDDSAVITASLDADRGSSSYGDVVSIVARCASNKTEVYAIWHDYVGDDSSSPYYEYKKVEVRVGDTPAETQIWDVSTDNEATFARSPIPLLKRMVEEDRLALRMTPYGENPITAIFQLEGVRDAIEPIASECGWELGT